MITHKKSHTLFHNKIQKILKYAIKSFHIQIKLLKIPKNPLHIIHYIMYALGWSNPPLLVDSENRFRVCNMRRSTNNFDALIFLACTISFMAHISVLVLDQWLTLPTKTHTTSAKRTGARTTDARTNTAIRYKDDDEGDSNDTSVEVPYIGIWNVCIRHEGISVFYIREED